MFAAIAQLIQAEVPQDFANNAKKTVAEGDASGSAFAELLALLQAPPQTATDPNTEADAESTETVDSSTTAAVSSESVENEVAGATEQGDTATSVTQQATSTPGITNPSPTLVTEEAKTEEAEAVAQSPKPTASDGKVVVAQDNPETTPDTPKVVKAAETAEATNEASVTKLSPDVVAEAGAVDSKKTEAAAIATDPKRMVSVTTTAKSPQSQQVEGGETSPKPETNQATAQTVKVVSEVSVPEEQVETVVAVTAKNTEVAKARVEAPSAEVVSKAAAPVVAKTEAEAKVQETTRTEVEVDAPVDEAENTRPRPSLFAALSRRDNARTATPNAHDVETLRLADSHRGRPVTVRAMLLMEAQQTPEAAAAPVETESTVKAEATNGVERAPSMARADATPRVDVPATPDTPPTRSTLPELAKNTLRGVRYLASNGERTITVKLVPESLGELRLDVVTKGDELSIRMSSASPTVRDALEGQLAGLRDQLAKDGVDVKRIDVSADMNDKGDRSQQPRGEAGKETARSFARMARMTSYRGFAATEPTPAAHGQRSGFHRGDLNVFA